jgi:hypothetical protein
MIFLKEINILRRKNMRKHYLKYSERHYLWWKDIPTPLVRAHPATPPHLHLPPLPSSCPGGVIGQSMSALHPPSTRLPASPSCGVNSVVPRPLLECSTTTRSVPSPISPLPPSPLCGVVGGSTRREMEREPHTHIPAHTTPSNDAPS